MSFQWPECDWGDCDAQAEIWWQVRWTIADFRDYYTCERHAALALARIQAIKVEGEPPVEIERHWLERY